MSQDQITGGDMGAPTSVSGGETRRGGLVGIVAGIVIVFVGFALFAERFWGIDLWAMVGWRYVWPLLIVGLGGLVVYRAIRRSDR